MRPSRKPNTACSSARNSSGGNASARSASSLGSVQITAARPPVSGRNAIAPRFVKRSNARPASGASVVTLKISARCA
jgi:hypothetical protein